MHYRKGRQTLNSMLTISEDLHDHLRREQLPTDRALDDTLRRLLGVEPRTYTHRRYVLPKPHERIEA